MKPNLPVFVTVFVSFVVPLGWAGSIMAETPNAVPPNVVFILVDDLGWSDVGCYGADLHETPHIDRLAKQGTRFTQAYAAAPVCSPTRASILTGQWPARLHMTTWHEGALQSPDRSRPWLEPKAEHNLPQSNTTLAEFFRNAGYQTWHIGKWHLGDAANYPENHGFDLNIGGAFWGAPSTFWYPYRGDFGRAKEQRYIPGLSFGQPGEYLPDRLTSEAIELISQQHDEPFFLNLWYHTVHTPIEAKESVTKRYASQLKPEHHHQNPVYAAMVHSLDENVGRLMQALDDSGKADNTVVIFFSDNGGLSIQHRGTKVTNNYPLRSGKGSLYEGGIREPLIVRWPGVTKPNTVCDRLVSSIDFYPTLTEMIGSAFSERGKETARQPVDGISLVPFLRDVNLPSNRDTLHWHYPHYYPTTTPVSAIRKGRWKLLHYYQEAKSELFDLSADLEESKDLSESHAGVRDELKQELDRWLTEVGGQIPVVNPDFPVPQQ